MNCVAFDWIEYGVSGYIVFVIPVGFAVFVLFARREFPDARKNKALIRVPLLALLIAILLFSYGVNTYYQVKEQYTAGDYEVFKGEVEYIGRYARSSELLQVNGQRFVVENLRGGQGLTSFSDLQCRVEPGMQVRIFLIGGRKIVRIEVLPDE